MSRGSRDTRTPGVPPQRARAAAPRAAKRPATAPRAANGRREKLRRALRMRHSVKKGLTEKVSRLAAVRPRWRKQRRFTGRAAVLALVLALLAISMTHPLKQYLQQKQEIAQMREDQRDQEQHIEELEQQKKRWKDPKYIRQQARERLQYVEPGEVAYVIIDNTEGSGDNDEKRRDKKKHGPWYEQMWESVESVDDQQ